MGYAMKSATKTATLPSLRVEPELRQAAESVLKEGESLSSFMEETIRRQVNYRKVQKEFIERGLRSLAAIEAGAKTYPAEQVMAELEEIIVQSKRRQAGE